MNLEAYDQIDPLIEYLYQMGYFTITTPGGETSYDGYSLVLSRLTYTALSRAYPMFLNDAYWGILTQMVFCSLSGLTCQQVLVAAGNQSGIQKTCADPNIGWTNTDITTWRNLETWVKAALKPSNSAAFSQLLSYHYLTSSQLTAIFQPNGVFSIIPTLLKQLSTKYGCSQTYCSYEEMAWLQWRSSAVSLNLPDELGKCGFKPSSTVSEWYPGRYLRPFEWFSLTHFNATATAAQEFLSYSSFLNPTSLQLFFNIYLSRNFTGAKVLFPFLDFTSIQLIAAYLTRIIPGFEVFSTYTAEEWLMGRNDPFIAFVNSMSVYEGGSTTANPFHYVAQNTTDPSDAPRHIMYSGKDDVHQTRNFYAYFGSRNIVNFGPKYNAYAPGGLANGISLIWNGSVPIQGSDGGQFGIHFDKLPTSVFVQNLMRDFVLNYNSTVKFHDLDLYRFLVTKAEVENSLKNPVNAKYYQSPEDVPGYMNLSSQYGSPSFVCLTHCFLCDTAGLEMVEYFRYVANTSSGDYLQERIFPSAEYDQPYVDIEPTTGVGVRISYGFTSNVGLNSDVFFPYFYQPLPGSPLYFPYYSLLRYVEYTPHQISEVFGALILARRLEIGFRVSFLVFGLILVLVSFVIFLRMYKEKHQNSLLHKVMSEEMRTQ